MKKKKFPKFQSGCIKGVNFHCCRLNDIPDFFKIGVIIHGGSSYDPIGKEGLNHFLEHIPFRGTLDFPTVDEIAAVEEDYFLFERLDVCTSCEKVVFSGGIQVSSGRKPVDLLRNLVFLPIIRELDVEKERSVIKCEFGEIFETKFDFETKQTQWTNIHPSRYRRKDSGSMGSLESIDSITAKCLKTFHRDYYCGSNIEVLLIGDINFDQATTITRHFLRRINIKKKGVETFFPKVDKNFYNPSDRLKIISHHQEIGLKEPQRFLTEISLLANFPKKIGYFESRLLSDFFNLILFKELRSKLFSMYGVDCEVIRLSDHCLLNIEIPIEPSKESIALNSLNEVFSRFANRDKEFRILINKIKKGVFNSRSLDGEEIFALAEDQLAGKGKLESLYGVFRRYRAINFNRLADIIGEDLIPAISCTIIRP